MTDMRPSIVITPLETERLLLTPLDPEADAEDLHEMYADPDIHAFGDTPPFERIDQTRDFLRKEVRENGGTSWAVRLRDDPTALGTIGIFSDQGTTIRGIGWSLRSSHWGRGITSEAAKTVVPFLLEQDGVDGLEAWVDPLNTRSLAVARNAGMVEAGRLPRTYRTRVGQSVVMVRAAEPAEREIDSVSPYLPVHDVPMTIVVFTEALGFAVGWMQDDPPIRALLSIARWSGSPGIIVARTETDPASVELTINVAIPVDAIADRVRARGIDLAEEPEDKPWYRRECAFRLPEGHLIRIAGATSPPGSGPR